MRSLKYSLNSLELKIYCRKLKSLNQNVTYNKTDFKYYENNNDFEHSTVDENYQGDGNGQSSGRGNGRGHGQVPSYELMDYNGYGYGYGKGDGNGCDQGDGDGNGDGNGYGYSEGEGEG